MLSIMFAAQRVKVNNYIFSGIRSYHCDDSYRNDNLCLCHCVDAWKSGRMI